MKKVFLSFGLLLPVSLATAVFNSCSKDDDSVQEVTSISLDLSSLTLAVGDDYTLTATVLPKGAVDKTVTWTSSSDAIAKVAADGNVTAVSKGTATITAKVGEQTAACVVTVPDPLTYDKGVVINGVKWATRNVDAPGTFAAKPESSGMFYQWNRKIGWNVNSPLINSDGGSTWDNSNAPGQRWEKANDPSPVGWRVPTLNEIKALCDYNKVSNEWATQSGINGRKFIDKTTGNTLFLPAAGCRSGIVGAPSVVDIFGYYWSSEGGNYDDAFLFSVNSEEARWNFGGMYYDRSNAFSVRLVAE